MNMYVFRGLRVNIAALSILSGFAVSAVAADLIQPDCTDHTALTNPLADSSILSLKELEPQHTEKIDKKDLLNLSLATAGMLVLDFFAQDALHEGSHALAAMGFGAHDIEITPYPTEINGRFVFGKTEYTSTPPFTSAEETVTLTAPMALDLGLLAAYTLLNATDSLPENDYARIALAVVAMGASVDLGWASIPSSDQKDLERVMDLNEIKGWHRDAIRAGGLAISVAGAIQAGKEIYDVFAKNLKSNKELESRLKQDLQFKMREDGAFVQWSIKY